MQAFCSGTDTRLAIAMDLLSKYRLYYVGERFFFHESYSIKDNIPTGAELVINFSKVFSRKYKMQAKILCIRAHAQVC